MTTKNIQRTSIRKGDSNL